MIPKRLIYCWFGEHMPDNIMRNIAGWKELCPDWEIIEVNEDTFDVGMDDRTVRAYENGIWAFVADAARFWALRHYGGGIYLDADIEMLRPIPEEWLASNALVCEMFPGYFSNHVLGCGSSFPDIYRRAEAFDGLPETSLNTDAYGMCPQLHGQSMYEDDAFRMIGLEYIHAGGKSGNYMKSPNAVMVHHVGGTGKRWNTDMGSTKPLFEIWIDGKRRPELETDAFGRTADSDLLLDIAESEYDERAMKVFGKPGPFRYVDMANYFQNESVMMVRCGGAEMHRRDMPAAPLSWYRTWLQVDIGYTGA